MTMRGTSSMRIWRCFVSIIASGTPAGTSRSTSRCSWQLGELAPPGGMAAGSREPRGRPRGVLLVGDRLEPVHDSVLVVALVDGDVHHEPVGGSPVPVLLVGLEQ